MLSALSAERSKLLRHKATWFLVWAYPLAMILVFAIALVVELLGGGGEAANREPPTAEGWIRDTAIVWQLASSNFGRFLAAAFAAVAFAGEYGWNTWKLIVPHRSRTTLLAAKYVTVFLLLYAALIAAGLLTAGLSWLEDRLTGDVLPAAVTLSGVMKMQGAAALATLMPLLFTLAYASLAAILTRSMVAALAIAMVVGTLEQLFTAFAGVLHPYAPQLVTSLYHALPGYHLANLGDWIFEGAGKAMPLPGAGSAGLPWQTSLAVAAAWTAGLVALTLWRFRRQDIN